MQAFGPVITVHFPIQGLRRRAQLASNADRVSSHKMVKQLDTKKKKKKENTLKKDPPLKFAQEFDGSLVSKSMLSCVSEVKKQLREETLASFVVMRVGVDTILAFCSVYSETCPCTMICGLGLCKPAFRFVYIINVSYVIDCLKLMQIYLFPIFTYTNRLHEKFSSACSIAQVECLN